MKITGSRRGRGGGLLRAKDKRRRRVHEKGVGVTVRNLCRITAQAKQRGSVFRCLMTSVQKGRSRKEIPGIH